VASRCLHLALLLVLMLPAAAQAAQPDSDAPPGASSEWLPAEPWVDERWLPLDEAALYAALRTDLYELYMFLFSSDRTVVDFARRRGIRTAGLAARLVGPRGRATSEEWRMRRRNARRVLDQGHLAEHMIGHAFHHGVVITRSQAIFGVDPDTYQRLRYADGLTPAQTARRAGKSLRAVRADLLAELAATGRDGLRAHQLSRAQFRARQRHLEQTVDAWLTPPTLAFTAARTGRLCRLEPAGGA